MKILCATDLLSKSESAIDRAGMVAEHLGADLSLLHVVAAESGQRLEHDVLRASRRLKGRAGLGRIWSSWVRRGTLATARCDVLVVPEPADVASRRVRIDHRSLDVITGA